MRFYRTGSIETRVSIDEYSWGPPTLMELLRGDLRVYEASRSVLNSSRLKTQCNGFGRRGLQ